jgi:hypothetical protein
MNRRLTIIASGITLAAAALAQPGVPGGRGGVNGFQQFGAQNASVPLAYFRSSPPVTGSPVQASEQRKTVHTLGDGTVIERADSNLYYRDTQGRTRTEQTVDGKTMVAIIDPVAHFSANLDATAKTGRRNAFGGGSFAAAFTPVAGGRGAGVFMPGVNGSEGPGSAGSTTEDLGTMNVNGVPAQGTRTTMIIPAGKIGNNRDIRVVNERWYSNELQMLVKSVNSDPRFGTTTYQLTNILRVNPDESLFQIPSDYAITEGGAGGRGGRGGAVNK